jgi:hypothetical protein
MSAFTLANTKSIPKVLHAKTTSGEILAGTAYTAGAVLAADFPIALAGVRARTLNAIQIIDQSGQDAPVDLYIFKQNPAASYTINTAFRPTSADLAQLLGIVSVPAGSSLTLASSPTPINSTASVQIVNTGAPLLLLPDVNFVYVVPVLHGSGTPTFVNGALYTITFEFEGS